MEPIITINEYPIGWEWLDKVPLEQNKEVQTKIQEINPYLQDILQNPEDLVSLSQHHKR